MPRPSDDVAVTAIRHGDVSHLHVYDMRGGCLIKELTDFARHLSLERRYSILTVEKRVGQVVIFWRWLRNQRLRVDALSDQSLMRFRDEELTATLGQPAARGDVRTAKRTVNDKLRAVMDWLNWLADTGRTNTSTAQGILSVSNSTGRNRTNRRRQSLGPSSSAVLFRSTGSASKHRTAFIADDAVVSLLQRTFLERGSSAYVAHRNALWAEIAEVVGFRRASICSLTVSQFRRPQLEAEVDPVILITPASQKFGYQNDFQFPVWLALRVCEFDEQYRQPMLRRKRVEVARTRDRVFLSSRDGRPMTDRAMTQIMSQAMRAAGAPKGVAGHALRAKFCNDAIASEYEARIEKGMDTSTQAIAMAVAWRMGHRNADSLYPYVARIQAKEALLFPSEQKNRVAELEVRIVELEDRIRIAEQRSPPEG